MFNTPQHQQSSTRRNAIFTPADAAAPKDFGNFLTDIKSGITSDASEVSVVLCCVVVVLCCVVLCCVVLCCVGFVLLLSVKFLHYKKLTNHPPTHPPTTTTQHFTQLQLWTGFTSLFGGPNKTTTLSTAFPPPSFTSHPTRPQQLSPEIKAWAKSAALEINNTFKSSPKPPSAKSQPDPSDALRQRMPGLWQDGMVKYNFIPDQSSTTSSLTNAAKAGNVKEKVSRAKRAKLFWTVREQSHLYNNDALGITSHRPILNLAEEVVFWTVLCLEQPPRTKRCALPKPPPCPILSV